MTPRKKKTATKAPAKRRGRKPKETEAAAEAAPAAPKKKRKAVKSAAKKTEESQVEPPEPKPTASGHKDPNVGKEGFGPCAACGWWGPSGATLCHHCGMPRSGRPLSDEEKAAREARTMTEVPDPVSGLEDTDESEPEEDTEESEPEEEEAPEYYQVELSMTVALHDALVAQSQAEGRDFHDILVRAVELGAIQMREGGELTDLPEKTVLEYDDQEDCEFQEAFEMAAREV